MYVDYIVSICNQLIVIFYEFTGNLLDKMIKKKTFIFLQVLTFLYRINVTNYKLK